LDPSNRDIFVQETPQRGVFVEGLTQEYAEREEDILDILRTGEQMRVVACTKLNNLSSRSHVVFFLSCTQRLSDGSEKVGRLSLADLAGSERVGNSGALTAGGIRLQEATKINCSLSALGHVIQALLEKQSHIPYRNSQLTRVLQETLGGNCKTALIVTCSAAVRDFGETLSSLRFATRARLVRNRVKVNLIRSPEQLTDLVAQLQRELASARREAGRLGVELASLAPGGGPDSSFTDTLREDGTETAVCEDTDEEGVRMHNRSQNSYESTEPAGQATEELVRELRELEIALEAQEEQLFACFDQSPSPDMMDTFDYLCRWGRVQRLSWRLALAKLHEKRGEEAVDLAEADIAKRMKQLADAHDHLQSQRLRARRQEAQSSITCNTMGDISMPGTEVAGESMLNFSMDRSLCTGVNARSRRSYISSAGHKASKVVRPICRRSIERRSAGGGTSSASSRSGTPRGSPRLNTSQLDEGSLSPGGDCTSHVKQLDPCNTLGQTEPHISGKLPSSSSFVHVGPVLSDERLSRSPLRLSHTSPHKSGQGSPRNSMRRSSAAWSDMVDEEQPVDDAALDTQNDVDPAKLSDKAAEEEYWKQKIAKLRAQQQESRREHEERRRRQEEDYRHFQADTLQHAADLENQCKYNRNSIPNLRLELEQVDVALAEAEAEEDDLNLQLLRLRFKRAHEEQKFSIRREADPDRSKPQPSDFETAYKRASTLLQQLWKSWESGAGERNPDSAGTCMKVGSAGEYQSCPHASYGSTKENELAPCPVVPVANSWRQSIAGGVPTAAVVPATINAMRAHSTEVCASAFVTTRSPAAPPLFVNHAAARITSV
jgi:hypothetical protein